MLRGKVATVADISTTISAGGQPHTVYKLYVSLPNGLTTTVNKKLPFRYGHGRNRRSNYQRYPGAGTHVRQYPNGLFFLIRAL